MKNSKAMGLGAMLIFLVVAIVVLPMIVRFIDKVEPHYVSGFEDMMVKNVPQVPQATGAGYFPDPNTNYLCSTDASGKSCPEGTFCDGPSKACIANYLGGQVPETGYFS
jgi:hypothetical protein